MSNTPRNTQFLGFAQALWREIATTIDDVSTEENNIVDGCAACSMKPEKLALFIEPLIARRAYDFLEHAVYRTSFVATREECRERIKDVPDMPELPEEAQ